MKRIILKRTDDCDAQKLVKYLTGMGRNFTNENIYAEAKNYPDDELCILYIDFEDKNQFENARKFVNKNKHLKIFAYLPNATKNSMIRAYELGCINFINKLNDFDNLFEALVPKKLPCDSNNMFCEFRGAKVLIVDDVAANISLLRDILSAFEFECTTFCDPCEAALAIEEHEFDLILLDVAMPKMNGFELAHKIRRSECNSCSSIVFISAYSQKDKKIQGFNLGSSAYIEKPLDPQTVRAQIYGLLKIQSLNKKIIKEKEDFIAMLTHDLKTPIRAQIQALNLLLGKVFGELNSEQKDILNEIMVSNKYMQNMTENILTRYKSENSGIKISPAQNSIKNTIESTIDNLKHIISQKRQLIKVNYQVDKDTIYYDEIEIKRVLTNLIVNASEHSCENSVIEITAFETKGILTVKVKDSGCGLDNENTEKVFEKLISNSKKYKKVGTGLGLYICKEIIKAHGGAITAKKLEKGTEFSFTLNSALQKINTLQ